MPKPDWNSILFFSFIAVTSVQVFYYAFFFLRLAFYKKKTAISHQQHAVSVIVCSRDEDENLAKHLPGLLVQDYPTTYQVVVVDDNSYDDSKYVLQELHKTYKHLHPVYLSHEAKLIQGKKYPLSIGIREASYELLLFTDADCIPLTEHWITHMQAAFKPGIEIVLGYSPYQKKAGLLNKLIRFETFHTALQYLSYALAGVPYMGVGRNMAYRKKLFFDNKGFSSLNNIPGGDDDLFINKVANKRNTAICIEPDSFTQSIPKKTWKNWYRQKTRHYSTAKYYKPGHKLLLGLYSLSQFLYYPLLVTCFIMLNWQLVLIIFAIRFLLQVVVLNRTMNRLHEKDLFPLFIFFDVWQFFYSLIFLPTLWKRNRNKW